jgi:hypothetical protein
MRRFMKITKPKRAIVIGMLMAMVIGPLLVRAVIEVLHDKGSEQYQNVYGLGIAWSSLLILAAVFVGPFLVALIARVIYFWRVKRGL